MSFKTSINDVRRKLMGRITSYIGRTKLPTNPNPEVLREIKRIFVCRPNHRLGNVLLMTPLIQELEQSFPNCTIDVMVKGGIAPIIFENYSSIDRYITLPRKPFKDLSGYLGKLFSIKNRKYDLAINMVPDSSSGKIFTRLARAKYSVYGELPTSVKYIHKEAQHIAQFPVLTLRHYLEAFGRADNKTIIPPLDMKLSNEELKDGKNLLLDLVKNEKKTISIFTFATGDKCYSKDWWTIFYNELLKQFSNYNIIEILPFENVSQIDFKAPSFYSKDVREMAAMMKSTELFIGADSGIMHLAVASGVPTAGLFSVTNIDKYAPYGKSNSTIDTRDENLETWMNILKENLNNQ